MNERLHWSIIVLGLCACLASSASANDASIGFVAGVPYIESEPDVFMASEHLVFEWEGPDARPALDGDGTCEAGYYYVAGDQICRRGSVINADLTYTFENRGEATTLRVGLPFDMPRSEEEEFSGPMIGQPISGYTTYLDGEVVEWEVLDRPDEPLEGRYNRTYIVEVEFEAGQTRTLRHTYVSEMGRAAGGYEWYPYVLTTGAGWGDGRIGQVEIDFSLPPDTPGCVLSTLPFTREADALHVHLTDWEPAVDFELVWASARTYAYMSQLYPEEGVTECPPYAPEGEEARIAADRVELLYGAPLDGRMAPEPYGNICTFSDAFAMQLHGASSLGRHPYVNTLSDIQHVERADWATRIPAELRSCIATIRSAAVPGNSP